MGYLDGLEPGLRTTLASRKLTLRRRGGDEWPGVVTFDVYWDDGATYGGDDPGLPVGYVRVRTHRLPGLRKRVEERWWASVSTPVMHEVAARLPDVNEAVRLFLAHLPDRYS